MDRARYITWNRGGGLQAVVWNAKGTSHRLTCPFPYLRLRFLRLDLRRCAINGLVNGAGSCYQVHQIGLIFPISQFSFDQLDFRRKQMAAQSSQMLKARILAQPSGDRVAIHFVKSSKAISAV